MTKRPLIAASLLAALALAAPRAHGQSAAAAEALFQEGQAALERGDLDTACPKLRESDRLDPANGTKLNLADCEEKRGHLASAWELYRKLSDSLPAGDERLPYVQERAQALAPRVPRLTLTLAADAPADTQASFGAVVLTSASFGTPLPVDPGELEVVVTGGGSKRSFKVKLTEGEKKQLEITPRAAAAQPAATASAAPAAAGPAPNDAVPSRGGSKKMLGYILGGVGVVGLGVGAVTGIIGLQKQGVGDDNCSDVRRVCNQTGVDANASARTMAPISTVGLLIGVLGVGAGAYFILTSSSDEKVALNVRVAGDVASLDIKAHW